MDSLQRRDSATLGLYRSGVVVRAKRREDDGDEHVRGALRWEEMGGERDEGRVCGQGKKGGDLHCESSCEGGCEKGGWGGDNRTALRA